MVPHLSYMPRREKLQEARNTHKSSKSKKTSDNAIPSNLKFSRSMSADDLSEWLLQDASDYHDDIEKLKGIMYTVTLYDNTIKCQKYMHACACR